MITNYMLIYFQPVNVKNWDLQVHFKVHGKGKDLFGDGFVIWYAKDRLQNGPVFGNNDFFHGLAIILDTYSNHNGPHNVNLYLLLFNLTSRQRFN